MPYLVKLDLEVRGNELSVDDISLVPTPDGKTVALLDDVIDVDFVYAIYITLNMQSIGMVRLSRTDTVVIVDISEYA